MQARRTTRAARRSALCAVGAGLVVAAPLVLALPLAQAAPGASAATVTLTGRAGALGVALPLDQATALARSGTSSARLLARFFPGASVQRLRTPQVTVALPPPGATEAVTLPRGGQLASNQGTSTVPAGAVVDLSVTAGGVRAQVRLARATSPRAVPLEPIPIAGASPGAPAAAAREQDAPSPAPDDSASPPSSTGPTLPDASPSAGTPSPAPPQAAPPSAVPSTQVQRSGRATPSAAASPPARSRAPVPQPPLAVTGPSVTIVAADVAVVGDHVRTVPGSVSATAAGSGLALVAHLDVEDYLAGLAGGDGLPAPVLQARAIVDRSWALATGSGSGVCRSQACADWAVPGSGGGARVRAAVATAAQVLVAGGAPVRAVVSTTTAQGATWSRRLPLAQVGSALGYPGHLKGLTVTAREPSGPVTAVRLDGDAGTSTRSGSLVADRLALPSADFTAQGGAGSSGAAPSASPGPDAPAVAGLRLDPADLTPQAVGPGDSAPAPQLAAPLVAGAPAGSARPGAGGAPAAAPGALGSETAAAATPAAESVDPSPVPLARALDLGRGRPSPLLIAGVGTGTAGCAALGGLLLLRLRRDRQRDAQAGVEDSSGTQAPTTA